MDVTVFIFAVFGLTLAAEGYFWIGTTVLFAPIIAFSIALARFPKPPLFLSFNFDSGVWVVVLAGGFLATAILGSPFFLGLAFYYHACVGIVERQTRYVPWAGGRLDWRIASRIQQPVVYWLAQLLFLALSFTLLVAALLIARNSTAAVPTR